MRTAQSRREARETQRKKTVRKRIAISGAAAILLIGSVLVYILTWQAPADKPAQAIPSSCDTTRRVTVETTKIMAEVLNDMPVDPADCIVLSISEEDRVTDTVNDIISGRSAPNLWIPDSSTRAEVALAGRAQVVARADSLAQSPGVIVSKRDAAEVDTWNTALSDTAHTDMGDPRTDSGAFIALLNATAETDTGRVDSQTLTDNVTARSLELSSSPPAKTTKQMIEGVATGTVNAALVSEADYSRYLSSHSGDRLKAYIPATGTGTLDYPMYQPTSTSQTNKTVELAAEKISAYLATETGKKALNDAGLRTPDGTRLPEHSLGAFTLLQAVDPDLIGNMWTSYTEAG